MRYCGLVHVARLAAAPALIRGVRGDRDVTLFGEVLGIQARGLLLHPAVRVRHDDRWIFLLRIVVRRGVDVGGDIQAVELVLDRVDIDLARLVLRDRAIIDERERVLSVVCCGGRDTRHCSNSDDCTRENKCGGAWEFAPAFVDGLANHFDLPYS